MKGEKTAAQEKRYAKQDEGSFVHKLKTFELERQNITNEATEKRSKSDFTGIQSYFTEQLQDKTETDKDNPKLHNISKFLLPFENASKE